MFWDVDKIRHIREEKHITRERLATMTGIPIQTLEDWEQHRHSPVRVNDLQNIASEGSVCAGYLGRFRRHKETLTKIRSSR